MDRDDTLTHHEAPAGLDPFDLVVGNRDGLPGVVKTRNATVQAVVPILGNVETWIIQSIRQPEAGDIILLQRLSAKGSDRIVIPEKVLR